MSKVIIFSTGLVKEQLVGPEIRVWEFASHLSRKGHEVTLAVPNNDFPTRTPFRITQYTQDNFRSLTRGKDVGITQGEVYTLYSKCAARIPTVCDLYDPYIVECLHMNPSSFPSAVEILRTQLLNGDFFLCASESQRLFYLGMLAILGRLDARHFSEHNKFENLIDIVPFGANEKSLSFRRPSARKKRVTVFLGGIYSWYEPFAALESLKIVAANGRDVRFLFTSFPYPIESVKKMEETVRAYATGIGIGDKILFSEWVPYEERYKLYSEIDIALVIHQATLEATLAFRTRILDFLSFGIPVITNEGGDLEGLMKDHQAGVLLRQHDPETMARAILSLVDNPELVKDLISRGKALIKERFLWHDVIEPLNRFCRRPAAYENPGFSGQCLPGTSASLFQKALFTLHTHGTKHFLRKSLNYLIKRVKET